jgi:hypothetical protein
MDERRYWLGYTLAIQLVQQARNVSRAVAQKTLDDAIAARKLRTKPQEAEWSEDDQGYIWPEGPSIAGSDFERWIDAKPSAGGKQARIIAGLAKLHPDGVPDRDVILRTQLQADLLKLDPSLFPLTFKTLKKAIEAFNATRKR